MRAILIIVAAAALVGLSIYAILDIIRTDSSRIRALPKAVWVVVVILFPVLGPILWLLLGSARRRGPRSAGVSRGSRAGSTPSASRPTAPDEDDAYLRFLRQQAERRRKDRERARDEEERRRREDRGRDQDLCAVCRVWGEVRPRRSQTPA